MEGIRFHTYNTRNDSSFHGPKFRKLSAKHTAQNPRVLCHRLYSIDHAFTCNQLVTEYQWAYRKGHSTELLLAHLR